MDKNIDSYLIEHTTKESDLLRDLRRETHLKLLNPRMISGPYQGKFIEMISFMINPDAILEIGTFSGYSTICLAQGLKEGGVLHTIEVNDELRDFALNYIIKSGLNDRIVVHTGNAMEIVPELNLKFDLVFLDGEKTEYLDYYRMVFPKVKKNGFIIADNVLWNNKVLQDKSDFDTTTNAIDNFNKTLKEDNRAEVIMLAIRDGLSIIRKITD